MLALLQQTQLVVYLLDLLLDKNTAVRRMADLCLDVVIEKDDTWAAGLVLFELATGIATSRR